MKTSIVLKNLEFDMSIGIYDHEYAEPQQVIVNGEVFLEQVKTFKNASIDETLNYEALVKGIKDLAQSRHYDLIETLIEDICDLCLDMPLVSKVHFYVEKTKPFPEMQSIGVKMEKSKRE